MWAFKTLWDKGLIYEGFRVLAYCWRCETPLSNTETRMDDVYRQRQDPAVTVGLPLETGERAARLDDDPVDARPATSPSPSTPRSTTSWWRRRPGHPTRAPVSSSPRPGWRTTRASSGPSPSSSAGSRAASSSGWRYTPPFDFFARPRRTPTACWPPTSSPRTTAPASSTWPPPSARTTRRRATPPASTRSCPSTSQGRFTSEVPPYAGLQVFEANKPIVPICRAARARRAAAPGDATTTRTRTAGAATTPLIYKAVSSWFVKVTDVKDRMVELNQADPLGARPHQGRLVRQVAGERPRLVDQPQPLLGQPDPGVGLRRPALPARRRLRLAWTSSSATSASRPTDLHRPFVDELTRPNPDDPTGERSTMRRVPEVLDCWFESGSMPFAQVHYPFENADWFEHHYPGDFIVEYIGQTRGWFYTLHVLATALFDRPAFADLRQPRDPAGRRRPQDVQEPAQLPRRQRGLRPRRLGRHALVPHVVARAARRQPRGHRAGHPGRRPAGAASRCGTSGTSSRSTRTRRRSGRRRVRGARGARTRPTSSTGTCWPRRTTWSSTCTAQMDAYDVAGGLPERARLPRRPHELVRAALPGAVLGDGRRDRRRPNAFDTLGTVLETVCRVAAPLLPLVAEEVWRGLTGGRSVHLTDWPVGRRGRRAAHGRRAGRRRMDRAREVASATLGLRKAQYAAGAPAAAPR